MVSFGAAHNNLSRCGIPPESSGFRTPCCLQDLAVLQTTQSDPKSSLRVLVDCRMLLCTSTPMIVQLVSSSWHHNLAQINPKSRASHPKDIVDHLVDLYSPVQLIMKQYAKSTRRTEKRKALRRPNLPARGEARAMPETTFREGVTPRV